MSEMERMVADALAAWRRAVAEAPTIAIRNRRAAGILRRLAEDVERADLGPCAFPGCPPGEDWPHKPCDHRRPHEPRPACHEFYGGELALRRVKP
jgi:hypothetical protein